MKMVVLKKGMNSGTAIRATNNIRQKKAGKIVVCLDHPQGGRPRGFRLQHYPVPYIPPVGQVLPSVCQGCTMHYAHIPSFPRVNGRCNDFLYLSDSSHSLPNGLDSILP